jgi:hypothetical protein
LEQLYRTPVQQPHLGQTLDISSAKVAVLQAQLQAAQHAAAKHQAATDAVNAYLKQ